MKTKNQHTKIEKLLLEAARMFNSTLEYEELVQMVLKLVSTAVNSEAALLFRVDHNRSDMKIRFMNCLTDCQMNIFHWELGQGVVGWVAQYKEPVIINDVVNDPRVDDRFWESTSLKLRSLLSVPLIGRGQMIGVIEAMNKIDGEFDESDLDVVMGLANQIAIAIDNANLYRQAKREALEKNLLYEIGKKLSGSLSLDEVLEEIMRSLKQAIEYTNGGVFVTNPETGEIDSIYTEGYDSVSMADLHLKYGKGLVGHVATTGEPVLVPDVSKDEHYITFDPKTKCEMDVPIKVNGRVIGVLNVESDKLNAWGPEDLLLLTTFASQAALSIERARLHEQLLNGRKIEEQLNIAREIQQSFLPKEDPKIKGYDISGINIPSGQVGGDYYDFIQIVEHQMGIAIGDVSGKGIPASLLMAAFRASLIAEIRNNYSIRTICRKVNDLMYESMKAGNFVTAVYGVLDAKNHILTFSNCGHNLPVLLRSSGEVEYLREGGPVFGVTPGAEYEERPIYIGKGDVVVLYTDGVVEVFDDDRQEFGLDRLIDILKENKDRPSAEIENAVYRSVNSFASSKHVFDDFTMIVLKRTE
ncbi:MAG: GAF domain-containing SpoIIE family protein phosphatase [Candidatus Zixiibacteriota bacterium]